MSNKITIADIATQEAFQRVGEEHWTDEAKISDGYWLPRIDLLLQEKILQTNLQILDELKKMNKINEMNKSRKM